MKSLSQKYIYTRIFIAILFPIVKLSKRSKFPLTDKWIKENVVLKLEKEENLAFLKKMDIPWGNYAKWDNLPRERQRQSDINYEQLLKEKLTL